MQGIANLQIAWEHLFEAMLTYTLPRSWYCPRVFELCLGATHVLIIQSTVAVSSQARHFRLILHYDSAFKLPGTCVTLIFGAQATYSLLDMSAALKP